MNKTGPIIIIEDDEDDQEILSEIFRDLKTSNELVFFDTGSKALEYLADPNVHPFLVFSDINMPVVSGIELRKCIFQNKEISLKCIPYLFFTTSVDKKTVTDAYSMSVQGFFIKPSDIVELRETIKAILEYWNRCYAPNRL